MRKKSIFGKEKSVERDHEYKKRLDNRNVQTAFNLSPNQFL